MKVELSCCGSVNKCNKVLLSIFKMSSHVNEFSHKIYSLNCCDLYIDIIGRNISNVLKVSIKLYKMLQ